MRTLQEQALRCFLALWVALAPVKAWAGSMTLLGVGGGSSNNFAITYVSANSNTTGATAFTFTNQNIGTADSTRLVVVVIASVGSGSGNTVSGVTIGGNAATQVSGAAASAGATAMGSDIWYLAVPSGSTATIVVTFSASVSRMAVSIYSVTGTGASVSSGAQNSSTSANTLSQSATIPTGGGAIAAVNVHSSTPGAFTPTNLISDTGNVYGNTDQQRGHNTSSSGATSMGYSWTTSTDCALSIVTFNP